MLALCLMLSETYYAQNYSGIIGPGLSNFHIVSLVRSRSLNTRWCHGFLSQNWLHYDEDSAVVFCHLCIIALSRNKWSWTVVKMNIGYLYLGASVNQNIIYSDKYSGVYTVLRKRIFHQVHEHSWAVHTGLQTVHKLFMSINMYNNKWI